MTKKKEQSSQYKAIKKEHTIHMHLLWKLQIYVRMRTQIEHLKCIKITALEEDNKKASFFMPNWEANWGWNKNFYLMMSPKI